jgi:flavodoxin
VSVDGGNAEAVAARAAKELIAAGAETILSALERT